MNNKQSINSWSVISGLQSKSAFKKDLMEISKRQSGFIVPARSRLKIRRNLNFQLIFFSELYFFYVPFFVAFVLFLFGVWWSPSSKDVYSHPSPPIYIGELGHQFSWVNVFLYWGIDYWATARAHNYLGYQSC